MTPKLSAPNQLKHYIFEYEIVDGEREYTKHHLLKLWSNEDPVAGAKEYLHDYWGENSYEDDGAYYSSDGGVAVRLASCPQPLNKLEYNILQKYIGC